MEEVISTIYFDGQFWVALIEKISEDGSLQVGKYIFGPEPTNTDLRQFYLNIYPSIPFYDTDQTYRIKKKRSLDEQRRCTKKSLVIYNAARSDSKKIDKSIRKEAYRLRQEALYALKRAKRKKKKKGH